MMTRRWLPALVTTLLLATAGSTRPPPLPDNFLLGRDATGEPCAAGRDWHADGMTDLFDRGWSITCRGVAASRTQGTVLAIRTKKAAPADPKLCGAPLVQPMKGVGPVEARTCFNPRLGLSTSVIRFARKGLTYIGSAAPTAVGPLEVALRAAAAIEAPPADRDATIEASVDVRTLPAPPAIPADATGEVAFDAAAALQAGIGYNHRGLYVEASRLLNDALSRLSRNASPMTRVELELEAGLADSNISQFDSADEHFARATALLAQAPGGDRAAFLEAKRATYRGLDLINRRDWSEATTILTDRDPTQDPLRDPAMLSRLNQPPTATGVSVSLAGTDGAQLSRLLLESQRNWARSVAFLASGQAAESRAALDRAIVYVNQLQRYVQPDGVVALKARIQRQLGRVAVRDGRLDDAVTDFDCAVQTLQGRPADPAHPCPMDSTIRGRVASNAAAVGPMLAETQLERASILARRPNTPTDALLTDYAAAVDSLIASSAAGGIVPPSMETYLDLLTRLDATEHKPVLADAFFRAIQSVGEPAIARQVAQLQSIVSGGGSLGAKVRDRAELERQVVRLRYEIAGADPANAAALAALEAERAKAETKLGDVNAAIALDTRFRAVDDQPVTVADVRAGLRPNEVYLKVTRLRNRAYAIVIDPKGSTIYTLGAPAADIDVIAKRVRASIRDDSGRLPFFDVAASYALFRLIAGPAEQALLAAKAIIVDPSGPLENLPAGVLVTSLESVKAYNATRATAPNDYSRVAFLAARTEMSSALSPRSFLIARKLPESTAPKPFIGFGENAAPAVPTPAQAAEHIPFGTGCDIAYGDLAAIMGANRPVSAAEIGIAAQALGVANPPEVTGRAFTDQAILAASARGDYLQYQVLHFATHGLPETRTSCARIPPSLITTLDLPTPGAGVEPDGLLDFSEIAGLRLNANLVVLSACETASGVSGVGGRLSGQDESAATLDGLVRAFITANARAVLATYWKVPATRDSEELIRVFYASGRTNTIGAALRDAQAATIRRVESSHPYYWGAYFLVGDASKTMLSTAPKTAATS